MVGDARGNAKALRRPAPPAVQLSRFADRKRSSIDRRQTVSACFREIAGSMRKSVGGRAKRAHLNHEKWVSYLHDGKEATTTVSVPAPIDLGRRRHAGSAHGCGCPAGADRTDAGGAGEGKRPTDHDHTRTARPSRAAQVARSVWYCIRRPTSKVETLASPTPADPKVVGPGSII
jgi:hypothetical protein